MAATFPLLKEDPDKQIQLDRMKRRATALLAASAAIFVVALMFESAYPWLGYVRATAEATIVGGLADWFAVTALFRHPLGIPIPQLFHPTPPDLICQVEGVHFFESSSGQELKKLLKLLSTEITVAQNFREQPRAYSFARVYGNNSGTTVGVPQEMMTTFDSKNFEPSFL